MNHVIVYLTLLAILCSYYVVHITGSKGSHGSYRSPFAIVFLCPALGVLFSVAGRPRVELVHLRLSTTFGLVTTLPTYI